MRENVINKAINKVFDAMPMYVYVFWLVYTRKGLIVDLVVLF